VDDDTYLASPLLAPRRRSHPSTLEPCVPPAESVLSRGQHLCCDGQRRARSGCCSRHQRRRPRPRPRPLQGRHLHLRLHRQPRQIWTCGDPCAGRPLGREPYETGLCPTCLICDETHTHARTHTRARREHKHNTTHKSCSGAWGGRVGTVFRCVGGDAWEPPCTYASGPRDDIKGSLPVRSPTALAVSGRVALGLARSIWSSSVKPQRAHKPGTPTGRVRAAARIPTPALPRCRVATHQRTLKTQCWVAWLRGAWQGARCFVTLWKVCAVPNLACQGRVPFVHLVIGLA